MNIDKCNPITVNLRIILFPRTAIFLASATFLWCPLQSLSFMVINHNLLIKSKRFYLTVSYTDCTVGFMRWRICLTKRRKLRSWKSQSNQTSWYCNLMKWLNRTHCYFSIVLPQKGKYSQIKCFVEQTYLKSLIYFITFSPFSSRHARLSHLFTKMKIKPINTK